MEGPNEAGDVGVTMFQGEDDVVSTSIGAAGKPARGNFLLESVTTRPYCTASICDIALLRLGDTDGIALLVALASITIDPLRSVGI